jgi:hypothetical protein
LRYVVTTCACALAATGVALGAIKDDTPKFGTTQYVKTKAARGRTLPKLVLPNVTLLVKHVREMDREALAAQFKKSAQVVAFFEKRGKWLRATRHAKCWEVPWRRSCTVARASYGLHTQLGQAAERRLLYELPISDDWRTAVRIAQRVFPGTEGWLLSCSASEGGWGRWVPNNQGSGVGGWLQMFPSTFWRMYSAARAEAVSQGFTVPEETASWYSPLGQALAGAWGGLHRRHEWSGAGC